MRALAWLGAAGAIAATALLAVDCSLVLDWNNYTGADASGGGAFGDGSTSGMDAGGGTGADAGGATEAGSFGAPCGVAPDQRCYPMPPSSDWSGPVELYVGLAGDAVPECGQGYSRAQVFDGYGDMSAADAGCTPCGCSVPQGGACSPPPVALYSDPGCSTPCGAPDASLSTTACVATSGCSNFQVGASTPTPGSCAATGGTPNYDAAVTWSSVARACVPMTFATQSCGADQFCVPAPTGLFGSRVCIMRVGDQPVCPGGLPYADRMVFHTRNVVDTRACSACSCQPATGASCFFPAAFPLPGFRYGDSMCNAFGVPFGVPSGCQAVTTIANGLKLATAPILDAGACAADGGQPTGSVIPSVSETFCCTP